MKRNLIACFLISALLFSCSTDQENNTEDTSETNAIIGSWRAVEFKAAEGSGSNVNLGADILQNLTNEGCYILTFNFNEDLTLVAENAVNYLEINATPTGLEVPCPTQKDTDQGTYTYDGSILTIVDSNSETVMVNVMVEGSIMSANASELDIPNFDGEGSLIFEKF